MSGSNDTSVIVLLAELPVFTTAILMSLGYWMRSLRSENKQRDNTLSELSRASALLVAAQAPMEQRLAVVERRQQTLREATAVLTAAVERYETSRFRLLDNGTDDG